MLILKKKEKKNGMFYHTFNDQLTGKQQETVIEN